MKKTTTIHLSGVLFNIEEDAYEILSQYLASIEKYFRDNPGKEEIIEDIENRMAEILSEKLTTAKQVVTVMDIQEIIDTMGKVEEFGEQSSFQDETKKIATKRFYRNPEDKILGGVCGGIAAYFDIDPLWIRLVWAILFFFFGTGFLFYLLLWIIIPEAKTPSQKLEMRGQKVNISNISKDISDDLNRLGKKTSEHISNLSSNKFVAFIQTIIQSFINFIYRIVKIGLKGLAILLLFLLSFIFIVLMSTFFTDNYITVSSKLFNISSVMSDFFPSYTDAILFYISVILLIGVPLLLMIGALLMFILNIRKKIRYIGLTGLILWIIGFFLLIYSLIGFAGQFSQKSEQISSVAYYTIPSKTIFIKMNNDAYNNDGFKVSIGKKFFFSNNNHTIDIGFPTICIKKSNDDSIRIKIIHSAFADNKFSAKQYARNISYEFFIQDTIIDLASKYDIPLKDKFHFQQVDITIEIPQGRYVYLSQNMKHYLSEAENDIGANIEDMVGKKWRMGPEFLQCIEQCEQISNIHRNKHSGFSNKNKQKEEENEEEK